MENKKQGTLWIEYHAKPVRQELEARKGAAAEEALAGFKAIVDALYGAVRKRNRRDGSGERAALFEIKSQLRTVYPDLSFDTKPSTVAKYVKRLVDDLGNARRAINRAMIPIMEHVVELEDSEDKPANVEKGSICFTGAGLIPSRVEPPWKPDPPAPETMRSSPEHQLQGLLDDQTRRDPVIDTGESGGIVATVGHSG